MIHDIAGHSVGIVSFVLELSKIPELILEFKKKYEDTRKDKLTSDSLEAQAKQLIENDFLPELSGKFVRDVCKWGNGHRFVDRVIDPSNNSLGDLAQALKEGYHKACEGDVGGGVARIAELKFLRHSFASIQLRFLAPDKAVILDSVIRENLGYPETIAGYNRFLSDCHGILSRARALEVKRPCGGRLRVCDIETAIYQKLRSKSEVAP